MGSSHTETTVASAEPRRAAAKAISGRAHDAYVVNDERDVLPAPCRELKALT